MSSRAEALATFWASFGWPAYEESSVPSGPLAPELPYITFQRAMDGFDHPVALTASLWDNGESFERIDRKLEDVQKALGRGGVRVPYKGGFLWICPGEPFALALGDPSDTAIKRYHINITAEFI